MNHIHFQYSLNKPFLKGHIINPYMGTTGNCFLWQLLPHRKPFACRTSSCACFRNPFMFFKNIFQNFKQTRAHSDAKPFRPICGNMLVTIQYHTSQVSTAAWNHLLKKNLRISSLRRLSMTGDRWAPPPTRAQSKTACILSEHHSDHSKSCNRYLPNFNVMLAKCVCMHAHTDMYTERSVPAPFLCGKMPSNIGIMSILLQLHLHSAMYLTAS